MIAVIFGVGLLATAFLAGGVAEERAYWPFGGRYAFVERLSERAGRMERKLDAYVKTVILTGYHEVVVESYPLPFGDSHAPGPFLALSDTEFLVATRLGELHHVAIDGQTVKATLVGSLGVAENIQAPAGVKDLLLVAPGKLLISMSTHDAAKDCYALGLFEFAYDLQQRSVTKTRKLFESQPCFPMPLALEEIGGRIVHYTDDTVLFTVGSLLPTTLEGDYGRIQQIRLSDATATVFATGTRNQQGLFFDQESDLVFETEHGPRGGDEINVLVRGHDYGWPHVTYGTNYSVIDDASVDETCVTNCGTHEGYDLPLFAFVPSIGIGNLLRYPSGGEEFQRWRGDLLVASLRAQTLYRLEYDENRIIYVEPIPLGERLRDIALLPNGAVALKTDTQKLLILTRAKAGANG
ncbi:MAG: PQQ-dependent sugar dehydrogenase [Burkholderiales bacterium]